MNKTIIVGIITSALGIFSGILETVLYGGTLDKNNIVQESFFLPLSLFLIFFGVTITIIGLLVKMLKKSA